VIRYASLFTGIGGFDLGFNRAGMRCIAQIEIDPHCRDILARHWPKVKRYEDVKHVGKKELRSVDLICGGFPCQDLSVAGRREGLAGERSGLWFEYHRIIADVRPRWVVIENVPGLLSSNSGRDFATLLRGLVECGYGVAWRILDAQYFGLAQRRRRVFIVANLGKERGCAAQVLFEREGGAWDSPPGRKTGQRIAALSSSGAGTSRTDNERTEAEMMIVAPLKAESPFRRNGGSDPIADEFIIAFQQNTRDEVRLIGGDGAIVGALSAEPGVKQQNYIAANNFGERDIATALSKSNQRLDEDTETFVIANTLPAHHMRNNVADTPFVAFAWQQGVSDNDRSYPVRKGDYSGVISESRVDAVSGSFGVRRLTPTECERLQGFPDGHTTGQSDSVRYRQLGNAVAVPCAEWIGRRIVEVEATA
jgi:DNA (cytosine-5)-methyltransferase 1